MKRNGNNRAMMASKTRIPEDWRLVRLGDVAEANRSGWSRSDDATILYLDLTSIVVPGIMSCPKELVQVGVNNPAVHATSTLPW